MSKPLPVIQSERPHGDGALAHATATAQPGVRQGEPGCLIIATPLAPARADIERWVTAQLGWRVVCTELVEIDFPSGNDAALARLAAALPEAPCWLVAVPAPFTAFSAFTQFLARIGKETNAPAARDGFVLVVSLGDDGRAQAPDPEWTRYWNDFLRAEAAGCAILSYTP